MIQVGTVLLILLLALGLPNLSQASSNLQLHHWVYIAIERLTALGLIDRAMIVPKPYSRKEAARYVARVLERIRTNEIFADGREVISEALLGRLIEELRPELIALQALPGNVPEKRIRFRMADPLRFEVDSFNLGQGAVRFRENRGGEYYADGTHVQGDIRGWVEMTDVLALTAQPKFIQNSDALGQDNSLNVYMRELNAKLTVFNIALEAGRSGLWWGPGYHGSLLLTDHPFPFDMVKLGSDEPFRLPWKLRGLGDWKVNSFLTRLERDRDFPRAKLFGLRLSYLPISRLELGLTRLTQFDGRGRDQSFPETVLKAYGKQPNQGEDLNVNEQVMLDFRATVPKLPYVTPFPAGLQLYGEIGSEDKWSKFPLPSRAAVLGGIYIPQVFHGDSLDFRIEYADTDLARRRSGFGGVWYNNSTYLSGMRYRGFPLGHHMGTDAIDIFIRTTRYLNDEIQLGSSLNFQERDRGQPVHERKREVAVDATWWISSQFQVSGGYTFQRIYNPGQVTSINPFIETYAVNSTSNNHLLWLSLAVTY
jgi:capsule assembly protein Wzi